MRCVTIINQKGGCGKTTTAISLAGVFARRGLRTLLIDMDPQSHCAAGLAIPEQRFALDMSDALLTDDLDHMEPDRLVWRISRDLDLAPSRMRLAGLEASRGGLAEKPDRERRLARVVERLASAYDICCIDCSPSIGLLTYNALIAATEILIPVETSYFSLQGAGKQVRTVETLEKRLGLSTPIWLLATIHDQTSPLAKDLLEELRRRFEDRVVPTVIRQDPRVKEAASFGKPVCDYAPDCDAARDYAELANWLVGPQRAPADSASGAAAPEPPPTEDDAPIAVVRAMAARGFLGDPPSREAPEATLATAAPSGGPLPARAADLASLAVRAMASASASAAPPARAMAPDASESPVVAGAVGRAAPAPSPAPSAPSEAARIVAANPGAAGFGAHSVPGGVVFIQPLKVGAAVSVSGDFNGWAEPGEPMRCNTRDGIHELRLALAGACHYRLLIDGRPSIDPFNRMVEMNPFGDATSVAFAGAARAENHTDGAPDH
jgi:chromosome partitioning protein